MLMLTLSVPWVNHVASATSGSLQLSSAAAVPVALLVAALVLVWAIRQLQPAVVVVAQLLRAFVLTALTAALIIGALMLLLATAVVN